MKLFTNLFVAVFFILAAVRTSQSEDYYVSGKVRYADNNEIVTGGVVKCFDVNGNFVSSGSIGLNGDYILGVHNQIVHGDIIGFPNLGPEQDNFLPTGYPSAINPLEFTQLNITTNLINKDIYVIRESQGTPSQNLANVSGRVMNGNVPVKDAIVYAKNGEQYLGFGISNSNGDFLINNLPTGDHILVAHRIGSESDSKGIVLNEKGHDNITLNVTPMGSLITTTAPSQFNLSQNYPNPFNPGTVISYSIPKDGLVSLKVYNSLGTQVAELVNASQSAGSYSTKFDAVNLSSGIYYYKLESNGFIGTKKMILIK
jgi:hypothetical protein